jgi:hypothetical protein
MSVSFLAGILLKYIEGAKISSDDLDSLRNLCGAEPSATATATSTTKPSATEPSVAEPAKKVRKIKAKLEEKLEESLLAPVDLIPEAVSAAVVVVPGAVSTANADDEPKIVQQSEQSFRVQTIDKKLCVARKIDKTHIPGTENAKIYAERQCNKKPATGSKLCKTCQSMDEKAKASGKDKTSWLGRLSDPIPDHLHIIGSKWYKTKYPNGLPAVLDMKNTPADEESCSIEEPITESIIEKGPAIDMEWLALQHDGIPMIRNIKNGKVYRADLNKEGDDMIIWSQFIGRWKDGEIDYYAEEDNDEDEE